MISIIIPTLNEAGALPHVLAAIRDRGTIHIAEIIISDARSSDATVAIARQYGAAVIINDIRGRARQMNAGAASAKGDIIYFLHADSVPPMGFDEDIVRVLQAPDCHGGCFRLKFDHNHWFLRFNAWFTRFDIDTIRFGDQSLFVRKEIFERIGGFREDHLLLEDQEIIGRIKREGKFVVMKTAVTTSARKYLANGVFRLQAIYFFIYTLYRLGVRQDRLVNYYRKLINGSV